MKRLGTPQAIVFSTYIDCKKRTKKSIPFPKESTNGRLTDDEDLVRFMLSNSSVVESKSERSFRKVSDAVNVMCKQLCPGQWCTRTHCIEWSSGHAYHCQKTTPSVCKIYKTYIEKKKAKEETNTATDETI